MAFKFFHRMHRSKNNRSDAILPVSYMIRLQAVDDLQAVNNLRSLTERLSLPDDEIKLDRDDSDNNQIIIYLSIYGFDRFALELKKCIIHQVPLDQDQSQFFSDTNVGLEIITNHFKKGKDENHPQFLGSESTAHFADVPLKSDFINATELLYKLLFFNYNAEDLEDEDTGKIYHDLVTLARNIKTNYYQQHKQGDEYFATIPSQQDFEAQNVQSIYVPVLDSAHTGSEPKSTPPDHNDHSNDPDSSDSHGDPNDPAASLTNNKIGDEADSTDDKKEETPKDTADRPTKDDDHASDPQDNDDNNGNPDDNKDTGSNNNDRPKTVGEIRQEQQNSSDEDDTKDDGNDSKDTSHSSPQDILKTMYAPHIYQMNVEFPAFTVDYDMKKPPSLEEAVKNNDFDSQLFMVQETNHIRAQANDYLEKQAQQVNQSFNFYMTRLALQTYEQLTKRINTVRADGKNNDELKKSVRDYYDDQISSSYDDLKQSQNNELNQRLDALKQEYEQKRKDIIAQSDKQYDDVRTQTKNKLQSDAEAMMNSSISKRDATLEQRIQDSKKEANQYLSHALQEKADKYKDMADNLGQQLFSSMQNYLNVIYPKLVDQTSILMNDQLQLNYSNSRLQASNADVYKKQADDYHNQLQQHQKDAESSINDYEDRLNHLREQLNKRDDTAKKYDRLLSDKNDLQDNLDQVKQTMHDQKDKINDLKKQVHNAPLGQPQTTAKAKTTEINYQSLQHKYRNLQEKNQEYEKDLKELAQELESKKHFWEK